MSIVGLESICFTKLDRFVLQKKPFGNALTLCHWFIANWPPYAHCRAREYCFTSVGPPLTPIEAIWEWPHLMSVVYC